MLVMLSALGSQFNTEVKITYHDSCVKQGATELDSTVKIKGNTARLTSTLSSEEKITELPEDVTFENTRYYPHLLRDFVNGKIEEKTYKVYDVRESEIHESTYTRAGTEEMKLAGKKYSAVILCTIRQHIGHFCES